MHQFGIFCWALYSRRMPKERKFYWRPTGCFVFGFMVHGFGLTVVVDMCLFSRLLSCSPQVRLVGTGIESSPDWKLLTFQDLNNWHRVPLQRVLDFP